MAAADWTFDELLTNGWHPHWVDSDDGERPFRVEFTFYRSEVARVTLPASGRTEDEARAEAARLANLWLREHPQWTPRPRRTLPS